MISEARDTHVARGFERALRSESSTRLAVIAEVKRLHGLGLGADDAAKQANWGPYTGWFLRDQQAPVAVRKVYDEIEGRLTPRP
mgnify:CR=1 FL=1